MTRQRRTRWRAGAEAGGLRPIDVGPPRRARQLEQLGFLHISLQDRLDRVRSAVKFIW